MPRSAASFQPDLAAEDAAHDLDEHAANNRGYRREVQVPAHCSRHASLLPLLFSLALPKPLPVDVSSL
jgi:hypothetical protein